MLENIFFVYILKLSNNKHYIGLTQNLPRRMLQHSHGRSKSTRNHLPFKLLWYDITPTRSNAREYEVFLKNRGAKRFLGKQI